MVLKCGGLPLGICVLGGLLSTKRDLKQWDLVHKNVISYLGKDGGVSEVLALSYDDLPSHLKPCFLLLGLFPENYAIEADRLVQMWIAEGFILHTEKGLFSTMEDIGKLDYLEELSQRCMVQFGKKNDYVERRHKTVCQLHDLVRELALSKARNMNFLNFSVNKHLMP